MCRKSKFYATLTGMVFRLFEKRTPIFSMQVGFIRHAPSCPISENDPVLESCVKELQAQSSMTDFIFDDMRTSFDRIRDNQK
jgi:hypothetical protein